LIKLILHLVRSFLAAGLIAVLLAAVFIPGCYSRTKVPIDTIHYTSAEGTGPRMLFVFLHGNGDRNSVFDKEGFVDAVRARGLPVDMISVDAHLGYYMDGTIVMRLKQDVIDPAREKGYGRIWLIGNSLGGFGSLSYVREYANDISGVVLLGPFLGEQSIIGEIKRAHGLHLWKPRKAPGKTKEEPEQQLWIWLNEHVQPGQVWPDNRKVLKQPGYVPTIYLGYGSNDRFAYAQDFLATLLPPEQVIVMDGGHDWSTWRKLWDRFLDQNMFAP
jgi:pimeloyl-ACP methyl ester carboxylesterase